LLNLSERTIESHRKNIRRKTGIKNKKENLTTHLLNIYSG
jgi:DNA-binding CsgD family transcriptional regulator